MCLFDSCSLYGIHTHTCTFICTNIYSTKVTEKCIRHHVHRLYDNQMQWSKRMMHEKRVHCYRWETIKDATQKCIKKCVHERKSTMRQNNAFTNALMKMKQRRNSIMHQKTFDERRPSAHIKYDHRLTPCSIVARSSPIPTEPMRFCGGIRLVPVRKGIRLYRSIESGGATAHTLIFEDMLI